MTEDQPRGDEVMREIAGAFAKHRRDGS